MTKGRTGPFTRNRYEWDRIFVSAIVLIVMAPLVIYGWVALTADKDARLDAALDRNLSTAQLIGQLLDRQCEAIVAGIDQFGQRKAIADAYRRKNSLLLRPALSQLCLGLPDVSAVAAYGADGDLIEKSSPAWMIPSSLKSAPWMQGIRRPGSRHATHIVRSASGSALLECTPVRDEQGLAGFVVAGLQASTIDKWLTQVRLRDGVVYVTDPGGNIIAGTCSQQSRLLPLNGYEPIHFALTGQAGVLTMASPESLDDHLIGYSEARIPQCVILVTQPLEAAFATTNFLAMRLSVLFLPVFALVMTGVWDRLRSARRLEELTLKLADQNEGLRAADRAKSDFLAQVSHDLRTPLAAMSVALSGMMEEGEKWNAKRARESLIVVNSEVDHLTARVQGLLEMARLEAGVGGAEREPRDLTDIVGCALDRMEPLLRGRTIDADFPPEPLFVECDQGQIEKLVMNLLENAVKYSPAGSPLHLSGRIDGDYAVITVRDEGCGLEEGEEVRVFEKFYRAGRTRAVRGTGLGLAICRAIADGHGGSIGARSNSAAEQHGSEFWFSLPILKLEQENMHG